MNRQIGILGGSGALGSRLTKLLSNHDDIQIKVSTRTENFSKLNHPQITYKKISLDSEDDLKWFIEGCDVVVNCTGYYNKNLIESCLKYQAHYVDTSGVKHLAESEKDLDKQLKQKCLSTVQFVGVNPGLTEVLIAYCKKHLNIDELELYFSGVGTLSKSAVLEMIETSEPPHSFSQMYINDGKPEQLNYMIKETKLITNAPSFYCVPIINHHFINCVNYNDISKAYFFNAFSDKNIIHKMVEAKLLYQNHKIEKAASLLFNAFKKYSSDNKSYTLIKIFQPETYEITFRSSMNWNDLTTSIVYHTVLLILKNKITEYGIESLYRAICIDDLLTELTKNSDSMIEINK